MPAPGALFGGKADLSFILRSSFRVVVDGQWLEQIVDSRVASFGQASELSVPLDGDWPEFRVAAFATQKIVSFSQSVPAEVSKLCVGATCHGTTRLETCIPDEIRVCTLP